MTIIELNEHFMLIKEHQLNLGFSFLISFFLARVEVAGLLHMSQYVCEFWWYTWVFFWRYRVIITIAEVEKTKIVTVTWLDFELCVMSGK